MRVGGAEVQLGVPPHGKSHGSWHKPFQSLNKRLSGSLKFTLEVWEVLCLTEKKKKEGWKITVVISRRRGSGKFFIPVLHPPLFLNTKEQ